MRDIDYPPHTLYPLRDPLCRPFFGSDAVRRRTDRMGRQVRTKTCRHLGCDKIPSYGYPCKSREFCKPHALGGMVYSAGSRCRFRGCGLPGVFNYPWIARGGSFCGNHKEVCVCGEAAMLFSRCCPN